MDARSARIVSRSGGCAVAGHQERMRGVMGRVSRAAWLYIAAVVIVTVALIAPMRLGDQGAGWWIELGVLQLLFLICDSTPTPLASGQSAWSPSSSATLAAGIVPGPAGAAAVGGVSLVDPRRPPASRGL